MPKAPFRFIHTSDLHLERPPGGVAEAPDHLKQLFVDTAYRAAQKVFDVALKDQVDAVILAGDIVDLAGAGPRALVFLIEQFSRLQTRNIHVYWAGGKVDPPDHWPGAVELPENVHLFSSDQVEHFIHKRDGHPIFEVLGVGRSSRKKKLPIGDFRPIEPALFSIAVAYGMAESDAFAKQPISYWALGGRHGRKTVQQMPSIVHYPGTPQGRDPDESGPRGCTLVHVDAEGKARTTPVACDVVRFHHESVAVGDRTGRSALERLLDERAAALLTANTGPDLFVSWTLTGSESASHALRRGKLAGELLNRLRTDYGQKRPTLWSVSIVGEDHSVAPGELYDQESILGEYLRVLREFEANPDQPIHLEPYLAERHLAGPVAKAVELEDRQLRAKVLQEAARLGVELLSGQEALS